MTQINYFVIGILFISFLLPILQSIGDIILTFTEVCKSQMNVIIAKNNCTVEKLGMELEQNDTRVVGFRSGESKEVCEDGEEEFEDLSMCKIEFRGGN